MRGFSQITTEWDGLFSEITFAIKEITHLNFEDAFKTLDIWETSGANNFQIGLNKDSRNMLKDFQ